MVVEDANAIGTTWLRTSFLDDPLRAQSRTLLKAYVDQRLQLTMDETFTDAEAKSEAIQSQLWTVAEQAGRAKPESEVVSIYIQAVNSMIDFHGKRVVAIQSSRLPATLSGSVIVVAVLAMFSVGFHNGKKVAATSSARLPRSLYFRPCSC